MQNTPLIWSLTDAHRDDLAAMADRVWGTPETLYAEYRSAAEHEAMLRQKGFRVTTPVAGIPTAVMGEAGKGGPVIAFLGEYDALPGLSQVAGIAEPRPVENGGNGHGCGHNLLGAASLLAACALKDWLEQTGTPGRVRYYGCPAEEGGAAKTFMVRDGAFADVDAAITWHPDGMTRVDDPESLANTRMDFAFSGRAAHAAASPHLGRSALDAVELMSVGVNYLREHMVQDARIHYAYLDAGGPAPNVVQARAKVRYSIRALQLADMLALVERVKDVARGAALMTGTSVEMQVFSAVSNNLVNEVMDRTMHRALQELGGVPFDEHDRTYAAAIQSTLSPEDIAAPYKGVAMQPRVGEVLCDYIVPLRPGGEKMIGSTDVADVTWACPTTEVLVATHAIGTPAHSWQITAQGKSPAAHKGMTHAAKAMARCGELLLANPSLLAEAKAEHSRRLAATPYICPLPADLTPPLQPRPVAKATLAHLSAALTQASRQAIATAITLQEQPMPIDLTRILPHARIDELPNPYFGKVRDCYDLPPTTDAPEGRRLLISSDRISAFDRILAAIPWKGQVLTQTARYWFDVTADICPNHVLDYPDPNVVLGRRLNILPVEVVVRGYLAGTTSTSILTQYKAGARQMYGHSLPDGLRDNQALPQAIITPTSKAFDGGHDEPLTADEILSSGMLTKAQWDEISAAALALFARGQKMAAERGLILVDTKYEFGTDGTGRIMLADEIHTPDSSRYWIASGYEAALAAGTRPPSFDKDVIRSWVVARCDPYKDAIPEIPAEMIAATAQVYIDAYQAITGQTFQPDTRGATPLDRVRANLSQYFA